MVALSEQRQSHPLVKCMIDLADEIDGVADFGITVCLIDEKKMAGRQQYIIQHADKICGVVDAIVSFIKGTTQTISEGVLLLQAELLAGSWLVSSGFRALQHFRRLTAETLRVATEAVRGGWE